MANNLLQLRVDAELKNKASDIYEQLGMNLPTAIRIFLTRSVQERGIPFSMTLPKTEYNADDAARTTGETGSEAEETGHLLKNEEEHTSQK
jgi:DNA-damage-inducible protein J